MSLFGKILNGLGIGDKEDSPVKNAPVTPQPTPTPTTGTPQPDNPGLDALLKQAAHENRQDPNLQVSPSSSVDISAKLEDLVKSSGQPLNWRTSIVDLLKLLNLDSSLESRKALAVELGCPNEKLADSAQMNTWLHSQVMKKIAENGGRVPNDLLK
ncbi:MAG: DUF3597 domain-containing protein [Cellvibrio sp.]